MFTYNAWNSVWNIINTLENFAIILTIIITKVRDRSFSLLFQGTKSVPHSGPAMTLITYANWSLPAGSGTTHRHALLFWL